MKLTILMPCLNEAETLGICIKKSMDWLLQAGVDGEVLVADNGSSDGSQEIAIKNGARVVSVPVKGYGSALFHGALAAKGEYIIMGDSDDSYDFSQLSPFIAKLDEGYDLVMGNRFGGGIAPGAMPWKNRYIGNPLLSWIGRILFKCPAKDFHCGLRGFRKDAFIKMDLRTTGMEYASEMVIKANLLGMKISEVPTTLSKDGRSRSPHLRPWRDGWRHLRFMFLFSPRWLFLIPGFILFVVSLLCYCSIFISSTKIGGVVLDINTLFYAQTGIVVGLLSIIFGIIVRLFGAREGLLQNNSLLAKFRNNPTLEMGSSVGICFIIAGIYKGMALVIKWSHADFGPLQQGIFLRDISISTLLITIGGISILSSFIIGFLSLPTREER